MEEDSLLCLQSTKLHPAWSIGLQQFHTMQSLPMEEKIILHRQLGIPSSLKTLILGVIRRIMIKLVIEQGATLAQLSQHLPLPDSLKHLLEG